MDRHRHDLDGGRIDRHPRHGYSGATRSRHPADSLRERLKELGREHDEPVPQVTGTGRRAGRPIDNEPIAAPKQHTPARSQATV